MTSEFRLAFVRFALACAFLAGTLSPAHAQDDTWTWTVAPYVWASDVKNDLTLNGDPVLGVDVPFGDIVDKLDGAFMGHFEGRKGNWGAFVDAIVIDLRDNRNIPIAPGIPAIGDIVVSSGIDLRIYDLAVLRRFSSQGSTIVFDAYAGARIIDATILANITLPTPGMAMVDATTGPSETDFLLGGRIMGDFTDRWYWRVKGDFSTGGSEGTYNLMGTVGYSFGQTGLFSMDLGYRHMQIETSGNTVVGATAVNKLTMSGPLVGFVFQF